MSADDAVLRDYVTNAVYKALRQYDEAKRFAKGMRVARNGKGPKIARGTGRTAQTIHVVDAVLDALREYQADDLKARWQRETEQRHSPALLHETALAELARNVTEDWSPLGHGTPVPEEATLPSGDARVAAL